MSIESPIIVIGSGRSGSTIFFEALAKHEQLGWLTNYDGKFPTSSIASNIHYVRRWAALDRQLTTHKPQNKTNKTLLDKILLRPEEAYAKWSTLCAEPFARDYLHNITASEKTKNNVISFFSNLLKKQNKERLIIKITGPSRIDFLTSIFPDAYFVHVKRNACAVVSSTIKTDYWQSTITEPRWKNGLNDNWAIEWKSYDEHPLALIAIQYRAIMELNKIESSRYDESKYIETTYDEFTTDPGMVTNTVCDYTKLSRSSMVDQYVRTPGRYSSMDNKYLKELSTDEISMINRIVANV